MTNSAHPTHTARRRIFTVLSMALLLTAAAGGTVFYFFDHWSRANPGKLQNSNWKVGDTLPPMTYTPFKSEGSAASTPKSTSDLKGKVLLINFWASWCGPCIAELPSIQALYNKFQSQGLDVLLVNYDDKPAEAIPKMVRKLGLNLPIALDPQSKMSDTLGFEAIPVTIILGQENTDGKVRGRRLLWLENGERDWNSQETQERIQLWLKNPKPLNSRS